MRKKVSNQIESSEFFTTLFREAEGRDDYHVERAKIEITEQIHQMMEKKGISQSELARKLGKNRAYISKILKGTTNFTIETIVRIASKLDSEWEFRISDVRTTSPFVSHKGWKEPMRPCNQPASEVFEEFLTGEFSL